MAAQSPRTLSTAVYCRINSHETQRSQHLPVISDRFMDPHEYTCKHCSVPLVEVPSPAHTSPVPDLIGTNGVPPPSKVPAIRRLIGEETKRLSVLETELARMQAIVDRLARERNEAEKTVRTHRDLLSLARALPPELLSEIFVHCLPEDTTPNVRRAPLLLGRVCRRWRAISLSTPQLWSSISITLHKDTPARLQDWTARARSLPLTMDVRKLGYDEEPSLAELLAMCAPRLQALAVSSSGTKERDVTAHGVQFPRLRKLDIDIGNIPSGTVINVFENAPQLQDVTLALASRIPTLVLPWHQLTRIHANMDYTDDFMCIIRQAPNLVEYTMEGIGGDAFMARDSMPSFVTHHSLESIRLIVNNASCMDTLFRCTAMPALRVCMIEFPLASHAGPKFPASTFTDFLRRSGSRLQALRLHNLIIDEQELIACVEHMPLLLRLELRGALGRGGMCVDGAVLARLRGDGAGACLLPQLQELMLDHSGAVDPLFPARLCEVVRSRWKPTARGTVTSLVRVELVLRHCDNILAVEDGFRPFEEMKREGLDVGIFLQRGFCDDQLHEYLCWEPSEGRHKFVPSSS